MSKISAADVNKLRKATGAGMMDCKKALVEAEGDFDSAVEILRKKGQKVAANRADRDSSEGAVIARVNDEATVGVIVSVNCETDFVAKNESYVSLANQLAMWPWVIIAWIVFWLLTSTECLLLINSQNRQV